MVTTYEELAMSVSDWLADRIAFELEWRWICYMHEGMWGVPCGPTLSMVNPPVLRGIKSLFNQESDSWVSQPVNTTEARSLTREMLEALAP